MSTPTIRAALERLLQVVKPEYNQTDEIIAVVQAIATARAALAAEPVGEGPSAADLLPVEPPNIQTTMAMQYRSAWREGVEDGWNEARAVLARWGHPTAPAAPEVGEVRELVDRLGWIAAQLGDIGWSDDSASVARAATLLQQQQHSLKLALQAQLDLLMEQLPAPAPAVVPVAYDAGGGITIHRTRQEPEAWAVRRDLDSLALDGTWDHEPAPSDRTQEWLARHRFASAEAAAHAIPLPQAGEGE